MKSFKRTDVLDRDVHVTSTETLPLNWCCIVHLHAIFEEICTYFEKVIFS